MKFEMTIWWHWLFLAVAMAGSAWNAWRVFFEEFDSSYNPVFTPFIQFWYELVASMAGWMALWAALPLLNQCAAGDCRLAAALPRMLLLPVAALGIFGEIPRQVDRSLSAIGELLSRFDRS